MEKTKLSKNYDSNHMKFMYIKWSTATATALQIIGYIIFTLSAMSNFFAIFFTIFIYCQKRQEREKEWKKKKQHWNVKNIYACSFFWKTHRCVFQINPKINKNYNFWHRSVCSAPSVENHRNCCDGQRLTCLHNFGGLLLVNHRKTSIIYS